MFRRTLIFLVVTVLSSEALRARRNYHTNSNANSNTNIVYGSGYERDRDSYYGSPSKYGVDADRPEKTEGLSSGVLKPKYKLIGSGGPLGHIYERVEDDENERDGYEIARGDCVPNYKGTGNGNLLPRQYDEELARDEENSEGSFNSNSNYNVVFKSRRNFGPNRGQKASGNIRAGSNSNSNVNNNLIGSQYRRAQTFNWGPLQNDKLRPSQSFNSGTGSRGPNANTNANSNTNVINAQRRNNDAIAYRKKVNGGFDVPRRQGKFSKRLKILPNAEGRPVDYSGDVKGLYTPIRDYYDVGEPTYLNLERAPYFGEFVESDEEDDDEDEDDEERGAQLPIYSPYGIQKSQNSNINTNTNVNMMNRRSSRFRRSVNNHLTEKEQAVTTKNSDLNNKGTEKISTVSNAKTNES